MGRKKGGRIARRFVEQARRGDLGGGKKKKKNQGTQATKKQKKYYKSNPKPSTQKKDSRKTENRGDLRNDAWEGPGKGKKTRHLDTWIVLRRRPHQQSREQKMFELRGEETNGLDKENP